MLPQLTGRSMRYLTIDAWEDANPYDGLCDEERCVNGKKCTECNKDMEEEDEDC